MKKAADLLACRLRHNSCCLAPTRSRIAPLFVVRHTRTSLLQQWRCRHDDVVSRENENDATTAANIMSMDDICPGDVVLFSPCVGAPTAQAQVILTGDPVSHSALVYRDPAYIVESHWDPARGCVDIALRLATDRFTEDLDRSITVHRLVGPPRNVETLEPVFRTADKYLGEPYSRSTEYLLGLFYLYSRLAFYDNSSNSVEQVQSFKRKTASLMQSIHRRNFPGRNPMVCAEFVYRCFLEAGPEFQLVINRQEQQAFGGGDASYNASGNVCHDTNPLNRLMRNIESFMGGSGMSDALLMLSSQTTEEQVVALIDMFGGKEIKSDIPEMDLVAAELIDAISEVAAGRGGTDDTKEWSKPDEHTTAGSTSSDASSHSEEEETADDIDDALFVMPGDLYSRCSSLSYVGTIPAIRG